MGNHTIFCCEPTRRIFPNVCNGWVRLIPDVLIWDKYSSDLLKKAAKIFKVQYWWPCKKSDLDGFVKSSNSRRVPLKRDNHEAYLSYVEWLRNAAQRPAELKRETFYEIVNIDKLQQSPRIHKENVQERGILLYFLWETGLYTNRQIGNLSGITYSTVSRGQNRDEFKP